MSIIDWLDRNDYGYPLGLVFGAGSAIAAGFHLWWLVGVLFFIAWVLCWAFG